METQETRVCKECGQTKQLAEFFKTKGKYTNICLHCVREKKRATYAKKAEWKKLNVANEVEAVRKARLQEFTPRQLMEELARRGYQGKLTYVETHTIDITAL